MKAIETIYNGYRFRSRLEARWAVFFDEIGMRYEYEPQGAVLNDGTRYLPDFYLPSYDLYVEIKPPRTECLDEYAGKCELFRDSTNSPIMLCFGDPAAAIYNEIYGFQCNEYGKNKKPCIWNTLFHSDGFGKTIIVADDRCGDYYCDGLATINKNIVVSKKLFEEAQEQAHWLCGFSNAESEWGFAARNARQARFEHGETPREFKDNFYIVRDVNGNNLIIEPVKNGASVFHPRSVSGEKFYLNFRAVCLLVFSLTGKTEVNNFTKWYMESYKRLRDRYGDDM